MLTLRDNGTKWGIPTLLGDLFTQNWNDWGLSNFSEANTTLPRVNIRETNEEFNIELAAPGMKKEDFKIELDNDMLVISSEKHDESEEMQNEYTRREFSYQSFQRSFTLSERLVNREEIKAEYREGILHITVPKKEEAKTKPVKVIEIS
ncbi:heat-shock protein [Solitalea longa]|uniref:Heat-shock protein n=1 Tax=Solitalea longa TaxID=2079460 RepID=A0A2S4ZWH6_9SPHI|nr:Hsp20/alpha crystallin family protein [Solitalea longa]POY34724.1 heat-shock protein [Solitalea longa]